MRSLKIRASAVTALLLLAAGSDTVGAASARRMESANFLENIAVSVDAGADTSAAAEGATKAKVAETDIGARSELGKDRHNATSLEGADASMGEPQIGLNGGLGTFLGQSGMGGIGNVFSPCVEAESPQSWRTLGCCSCDSVQICGGCTACNR